MSSIYGEMLLSRIEFFLDLVSFAVNGLGDALDHLFVLLRSRRDLFRDLFQLLLEALLHVVEEIISLNS